MATEQRLATITVAFEDRKIVYTYLVEEGVPAAEAMALLLPADFEPGPRARLVSVNYGDGGCDVKTTD